MGPIKASYVFLDTVVFIRANFDYKSPRFISLTELAESGRIRIFLTDLTLREIKANLIQAVERAVAQRADPILRNSVLPEVRRLFKPLKAEKLKNELLAQLDAFLDRAKVTVLAVPPTVLGPVLDAYFAKQPPFGSGKNKAEFPDALALQTLMTWGASNRRSMAVVSHDNAVKEACDIHNELNHFDDLANYLDAVASEDETLAGFVRSTITKFKEKISKKAAKQFPLHGFILTDVEGDVGRVDVTEIDFGDDVEIISLAHDHAVVELPATVTFTAQLTYDEPGTGSWDSEDKVMYFPDRTDEAVERTIETSVGVEVTFDDVKEKSFKVHGAWFEGSADVEIESDHERDWPYK